ncbi:MAG: hypothetical protein R6X02_13975 [Enhygromyxa sp.]
MHGLRTAFALAISLVGLTTLTACNNDEPDDFGTIRVELAPLNGNTDIFAGTTQIVATVHYETCLQEFYMERKPTFQKDGPDGAPVFDEWAERLCGSEFDHIPDCEVTSIDQTLIPENNVYTLKVTYKINDISSLPYRMLHIGPLPVEEFAACSDGQRPRVELQQSGLLGFNSAGVQIWRISTLPGSNVAIANQGAPLRIELIETNN